MTGEAMPVFPREMPIVPRQLKTSRTDGTIPIDGPRDLDKDAPYDPLAALEEALRNSRLEEDVRNATKINLIEEDTPERPERPAAIPNRLEEQLRNINNMISEDPPMATPERPYVAPTPQPPRPISSELDIQFVNKICRITGTLTTREDFERAIGMLTAWTKFFPSTTGEKNVEAPTLNVQPISISSALPGNIVRPPERQEFPGV
jgi:hypothetical protein